MTLLAVQGRAFPLSPLICYACYCTAVVAAVMLTGGDSNQLAAHYVDQLNAVQQASVSVGGCLGRVRCGCVCWVKVWWGARRGSTKLKSQHGTPLPVSLLAGPDL